MDSLEYRLIGNEYKLLQFLKTYNKPISQQDMSVILNMTVRTLRTCIKSLKEYKIIGSNKVRVNGKYPSEYVINSQDQWDLDAFTTREFINKLPLLLKQEELKNGDKKE